MALVDVENLGRAGGTFGQLPVQKQLTILVAVALSIAIGVYVALWSKSPELVPLYASLNFKESSEVADELQKMDVEYKIASGGNGVLVPASQVHEVRMKLAALGLPKGAGNGYELLDKSAGFGTSQFMENVKYKRSVEGEIARTISSLDVVRTARVHLAVPKQTSFVKRGNKATASVMVDLYGGQELTNSQVQGIVHLTSSSIPGLSKDDVTVIDQRGNLLTNLGGNNDISMAVESLNYKKQFENELSRKIIDLLAPVYGHNGVKAQVSADLDFTIVEKTQENFDSKNPNVRSEAVLQEKKSSADSPEGIPGALSNQPPSIAQAPEALGGGEGISPEMVGAGGTANFRKESTRNYELDKTITHEKSSVMVKKLSVAVMVNDKISFLPDGSEDYKPLSEDELGKVEALIKDAIGFNEDRGDKVSVVNSTFSKPPPIPDAAPPTLIEIITEPSVISIIKQVVGGIFVLIIIFGVIKPMIKSLSTMAKAAEQEIEAREAPPPEPPEPLELPEPDHVAAARIETVKQIAHDDSKKAAQVIMDWVGKEED